MMLSNCPTLCHTSSRDSQRVLKYREVKVKKAKTAGKKGGLAVSKGAVAAGKGATTSGNFLKGASKVVGAGTMAYTGSSAAGRKAAANTRAVGATMVHGGRASTNVGRVGRQAVRGNSTKNKRRELLEKAEKQGGKSANRAARVDFV